MRLESRRGQNEEELKKTRFAIVFTALFGWSLLVCISKINCRA
jgi:hypothetical protein